jgi:hypothetical protein
MAEGGGVKMEAEAKEKVPSFTLPLAIVRFLEQDDALELKSDHDYFEALLAVEMARSLTYKVGRSVTTIVFSLSEGDSSFAQPTSEACLRGKDLHVRMQELVQQLDEKRISKLKRMHRRPVVETFLDAMEATDLERKIFRFVVVHAANLYEACDQCRQFQKLFRLGDYKVCVNVYLSDETSPMH